MQKRCRGFTLIELLVVVSITTLLLGIMLPTLGAARDMARQSRGMSDLRQMMLGYTQRSIENNGDLLYGYSPGSVNGQTIQINDGGRTYGPPVVNRYPWRLSPYVGDVWDVIYSHDGAPDRPQASDSDSDAFMKAYTLSISPTFGINSVYVGGHLSPFYKGFIDQNTTAIPNTGKHVVFRDAEVKRPSSLIVFTEVQRRGGGAMGDEGHFWATPPNAAGDMWEAKGDEWVVRETSRVIGLPMGRYRNSTITGFMDSHIEMMRADELDDMALWANEATDNDYDVP